MNKKGDWLFEAWPELTGIALLIVGFIIATASGSAVVNYFIVLLCGGVFGRIWYRLKYGKKLWIVVILIGFLIGFSLGSFYGNRKMVVLFFFLGMILSYYIHNKGYIHTEEW